MAHNIKLTVAYDGSDFHGWQIQPAQPTVQGVLSELLQRLTQEQVTLYGAGRTDAGVHAWGQVVNFVTNSEMPSSEFMRALNALLPPSVRIREAREVSQDFHARWLASAKTYRYRIFRGPIVPPFNCRYVLHYPYPLSFAAMAAAARLFEGEHDFTSFGASTGSEEDDRHRSPVRCIYRSQMLHAPEASPLPDEANCSGWDGAPGGPSAWEGASGGEPQEWVYVVRGKSFLRHMVRKIVGTLLEIGRGRLAPEDVPRVLALRDRACSGPTAEPHGLCLMSVEYEESALSG